MARSTADGGNTRIVSDGTQSVTMGEGDEDLTGQTREPTRQPTIRDLLTHTAGFTYGVFGNTEVDQQYREAGIIFDDATRTSKTSSPSSARSRCSTIRAPAGTTASPWTSRAGWWK